MEAAAEGGVGADSGPVWLYNVSCSGTEVDLSLCGSQMLLQNQCSSRQRAQVKCSFSAVSNVRLVNGGSRCSGRLEVYYEDTWGTVCDEDWNARDVAVVCKQLGCGPAIDSTQQKPYGPGSGPVWLKRVLCSGSESHISQCGSWVSQELACSHMHDVGVTCLEAETGISKMSFRNGSSRCAGRVEVYSNNTWGRVQSEAHDHVLWDLPNAVVMCKQLDCGPLLKVDTRQDALEKEKHKLMLKKEIGLDNEYSPWGLFCSGSESSISQCGAKRRLTLQPYQHLNVECSESGVSGVRLVDGDGSCAGRVEVKYTNTWGTVCDYRWDLADAKVVCRELGCGYAVNASHGTYFQPGSGPVWLKAVYCSGNETRLSQCGSVMSEHYPCDHSRDAGVICSGPELESSWSSWVFRFIIYTLVFASIHLGFFLCGHLEDRRQGAGRN
uniref:Scavenger receptor cysteine-rich type 1 protein M130-like n=1 Tax=Geotrypetes seraphini TaxID=260995 RepID=A0A6P8S8I8_GEOSA|nr:scavenger receptor cysteine-rich type 1 protein M130-like [Geotrypetes seraphini]